MKKTQQRKIVRSLAIGSALIMLAAVFVIHFPVYIAAWRQSLGWVAMILLAITFFSPIGRLTIGDNAEKKSWWICLRQVTSAYLLIAIFLFTLFLAWMTTLSHIPPEQVFTMVKQNFAVTHYVEWTYPWVLYVLGAVLIGGVGYSLHKPKMSAVAEQLFLPKQLSPLFISTIDYLAVFGFYIGLLAIIGMSVLASAQLVCALFGYSLNFNLDLAILGLGFALIYLPISSLWKSFKVRLEKSRRNPGTVLLWLLIVYSVFVLLMYALLHIFLNTFTEYFTTVEKQLPQVEGGVQLAQLPLLNIIWGFSLISMTIVGAWWAQIMQGYTVRQTILTLLAPLALAWAVYQLFSMNPGHDLTALQNLVMWLWTAPQVYLFSLIPAIILIAALWRQNRIINAIFWVFPNESGRKLWRISKAILWGSMFVGYAAAFNLLTGLYFLQMFILLFGVFASFSLAIVILGYIRFFINKWKTV